MSLILDALNRAEQERKRQDQVPDIHSVHLSPAMSLEAAARTRRRLLIAGGLLLLLVIAGIVVWQLRSPAPEIPTAQVLPTPPVNPVVTSQEKTPNPVAVIEPEIVTAPVAEVQPAQKQATPDAGADIKNLYAASEENKPEVASVPEPIAELYTEETPEESESVTTVFPVETQVSEPLPEVKIRSLDAFPNLPFFNDLPWNQKQQIPTISYSRHNYLPNAVSSVVINGATRGIGNLAPGEFIIEDIVSDGVVLRYKDRVFKLPALSGWVNM